MKRWHLEASLSAVLGLWPLELTLNTTDICLHLRSTTQWNKHLQRNWFSAAQGQCLAESEDTRQMCTLEGQDGKGGASSMH